MNSEATIEKKLRLALLVTSILTLVLGLLTLRVVSEADKAAQWVRHTYRVLDNIAIAREATIQIESMTRGYMIDGDKSMLAERDAVAKRRTQAVAQIEQETADNPVQQARLPALRTAAAQRRALSDQIIMLRNTQGFEAARIFSGAAMTMQTRSAYLVLLGEMDAHERGLLKQREAEHEQGRASATAIGVLTAVVTLGTLFFAFLMISRHALSIATARQKLQESNQSLQVAKDAAEHANASKDTFLATMSHEIRTPMGGLLGMLELLALSKLNTEQTETLAVARDSGQALGRIIDDILDHAKINAGKLAIFPEPASLRHLLQRNASAYFAVASRKGLTLCQTVDPRLGQFVLVDPLRLLQVLGNLVSNAIKFTEKGSVEVRADWVRRAGSIETVRLSVKDTGIGMMPEVQARVFQPFEQAGIDTQRLYGGTGLGLAISRRLAQMMGCDIVIESAPGLGTTASVTLELTVTDAQPMERLAQSSVEPLWQTADADSIEAAAGPWVLAVDDNPTNRLLITRQLAALGIQVQTAAHGHEALARWRAGIFALVITDCNMPEMDGYALTRALRDAELKENRARTPVLGWTANALPNTLSNCRAAGMDDVLTKPSQLMQLRVLLAKYLPDLPSASVKQAFSAVDPTVVNLALLQEVCGNSPDMLREFIKSIRGSFQAQIPELTLALQGQHMEAVAQASHKMKSSAGIIGAQSLLALCTHIEQVASSGGAADLPALCSLFGQEAGRVTDALLALDVA